VCSVYGMVLRGEVWIVYGIALTGESVEYLRNGTDRGKCEVFTERYCQGNVWSVYGMIPTGESV